MEQDQITIRGEIKFQLDTANILPESKPTLTYIADLINTDVEIGHVVIEGHASEEGSYIYNYNLSNLRARAIFKALVESGVHPDRISHRGYGEAFPNSRRRSRHRSKSSCRITSFAWIHRNRLGSKLILHGMAMDEGHAS